MLRIFENFCPTFLLIILFQFYCLAVQQKNSSKISSTVSAEICKEINNIGNNIEEISKEINLLELRTTVKDVCGNPFSLLLNENAAGIFEK